MTKPHAKIGRPLKLTPQLLDNILALVASGLTLTRACRSLKADRSDVCKRLMDAAGDHPLAYAYARATQMRADALADQLVDIMDEADCAETSERVQALRLKADTLKWLASKLLPRIYGEQTAAPQGQTINIQTLHLSALKSAPPLEIRALPATTAVEPDTT